MKYQFQLLEWLDSQTIDTFPRSLILSGARGCGKMLFTIKVIEKFGLQMQVLENLNQEVIDAAYMRVEPIVYVIKANNISIKEQNTMLKFVEEPLKNAFIIIHCESKKQLISTILNRCQLWNFNPYTIEQLAEFITPGHPDTQTILHIAKTPGQVLQCCEYSLGEMFDFACKIADKIQIANHANILKIPDSLAFKDEKGKYPIKLFLQVLKEVMRLRATDPNLPPEYIRAFNRTVQLVNDSEIPNINMVLLFKHYLFNLRCILKGD